MPRALRIEHVGAIYHVMNRGDHREPIFREDRDHLPPTAAQTVSSTPVEIISR